jgi:hypothetical protein
MLWLFSYDAPSLTESKWHVSLYLSGCSHWAKASIYGLNGSFGETYDFAEILRALRGI